MKRYIIVTVYLLYCLVNEAQTSDTIVLENYLLKSITTQSIYSIKKKNFYANKSNLVFLKGTGRDLEISFFGQPPLPYLYNGKETCILPVVDGYYYFKPDTLYSFKLIRICNDTCLAYTYYDYFTSLNPEDCSFTIGNKPKKNLPSHYFDLMSPYFYSGNHLYKIEFIVTPPKFKK
jgi:hypothetical protein